MCVSLVFGADEKYTKNTRIPYWPQIRPDYYAWYVAHRARVQAGNFSGEVLLASETQCQFLVASMVKNSWVRGAMTLSWQWFPTPMSADWAGDKIPWILTGFHSISMRVMICFCWNRNLILRIRQVSIYGTQTIDEVITVYVIEPVR